MFSAFAVDPTTLVSRFTESLQLMKALWTESRVTFNGRFWQLDDAAMEPKPVQQPHPPIWIGASGEKRMMPIAARYADVWHSYGPPEYMAQKSERLSEMAEAAGRDPGAIRRASSLSLDDVDEAVRLIDEWEKVGFDYLVCGWPGDGHARIEEFAKRVLAR
jgi:alkanesulfonate monooxygenase SsuD/methylene tetrahydromethanopterin reductase-like flavin-dependent oxidoreductase (luciferase family)